MKGDRLATVLRTVDGKARGSGQAELKLAVRSGHAGGAGVTSGVRGEVFG